MMKRGLVAPLLAVALLLNLGLAPVVAAADPVRIAVISIQDILDRSVVAREARGKIEGEIERQRATLQREQAALEEMREEIEKKSSVWSDQVRAEREREFQRRFRAFEGLNEDAQLAVQQQEKVLMEPVLLKLDEIIAEFGRDHNYDLILEYTMKGLRSRTGLLYAAETMDISEQVRQELDKRLK